MLITSWEPQRLAPELTTVVDAAAASLWLEPKATAPRAMLTHGFARVFGRRGAAEAARAALACDRYPFSGYPRWQVNERWDVASWREPLVRYEREVLGLAKLVRAAKKLPIPLRTSVELRRYLAERDVFLRHATRGQATPRQAALFARALASGLRAARVMWSRTRDPRARGPNEEILLRDKERLRRWEDQGVVGGRWQLCYLVENFAPAAQWVSVEQQRPDGTWETRQACHTIEFQARAARRWHGLVREHAAPVSWDRDATAFPRLRFVLRGLGQVKIAKVELTDGKRTWRAIRAGGILGRPAPRRGWPALDWAKNQDVRAIRFQR
jgi:hypothetical protein